MVLRGVSSPVGFCATVFGRGTEVQGARADMLASLRDRLVKKGVVTDATRLEVESIEEIAESALPEIPPGLAFYRE